VWERDERCSLWINLKDGHNIIDLDAEDFLINRMCEYDLSRAEVNLLNCCQWYSSLQYSICRHLRTLPRGQHFNMFPWTHRSITSTKIPITYPAASTTKIGATVSMLTSIADGCSLCSIESTYCWRILA